MKNKRVIFLAIVMVVAMFTMVACHQPIVEYGVDYKQVYYNSQKGEFVNSGSYITMEENYRYKETYKVGNEQYETFDGVYEVDNDINLLFMELNSSSFKKFKDSYRSKLKNMGLTNSEINEFIMPNVVASGELFKYKDYLFKSSSIVAAKIISDDYRLDELNGLYRFSGLLDKKDSVMEIRLNEIYLEGTSETGDTIYTEKIGECTMNNDFISITPTVALEGGDPNDTMKYLVADIIMPARYSENLDEDGRFDDNDVITYYANVKVRVLVSTFYTLKETNNRPEAL